MFPPLLVVILLHIQLPIPIDHDHYPYQHDFNTKHLVGSSTMCFNDKPWKRCTAFRYIAYSKHSSTHIQRDILLQSFFSSTYILIFVALASLVSSLPFNIFRVILSPPLLYLEFLTSCCRRGIRAI